MSDQLHVCIIQSQLEWENPKKNLKRFDKHIESVAKETDVVVLPEMFTSGFTMNPSVVAESMNGDTISWLKEKAQQLNAVITGSVVIEENSTYHNRLLWVEPSGEIQYYNKRHTFTLAGEHKVYKGGEKKVIINYKGWKICPLICYDLRFPVWARNTEDYDVLMYVANWPKPRISAWDALLKARAIENMSYCIGVNRVGLDNNGHHYPGHSAIYDGLGEKILQTSEDNEAVKSISLQRNHLETIRQKLRFLEDRDQFNLQV